VQDVPLSTQCVPKVECVLHVRFKAAGNLLFPDTREGERWRKPLLLGCFCVNRGFPVLSFFKGRFFKIATNNLSQER
jgi:hypothetical protein